MKVELVDKDTGNRETILDQQLGTISYDSNADGTKIAYQGGGVWKKTPSGSVVVAPPEFNYRGKTLTLPVMVVEESSSISPGNVRVTNTGSKEIYPTDTRQNPVKDKKVVITITSEFYRAWGAFFEERSGTKVTYAPNDKQVIITLITPYDARSVQEAAVSAGSVYIQANGGSDFSDSYNSDKGAYRVSKSNEGDIIARGNVEIQGSATLNGDIESGDSVSASGGAKINGNISYVNDFTCTGGCSYTGWANDNASVQDLKPVDSLVENRIQDAKNKNDNSETSALNSQGQWTRGGAGTTITLTAGTYYVTEDLAPGTTLELDTSDGDVIIAADKDVKWKDVAINPASKNPQNRVLLYTNANKVTIKNSQIGDQLTDKSPWFRMYGKAGLNGEISTGAVYTGLIYAPSKDASQGDFVIKGSGTEVYGGIVAGGNKLELSSGATIHFDKALTSRKTVVTGQNTIPRITYLHITVNNVEISD